MKEMKVINTSQEKQRDAYFDIVKSYAIFLVVLGHVIQMFNMKWESDNCFLAIYTFHMPLFIWISGHFFVHSVRKYSFAELLKKRFVQLMLPSMSMGIINFLIIGGVNC